MREESGSHPKQSYFPVQRPQGNSGEAKNFSSFWLHPFLAPLERIRVNLILLYPSLSVEQISFALGAAQWQNSAQGKQG